VIKWLVAFALLGALWFVMFRSVFGPSMKWDTFVETPEVFDEMERKYSGIVSSRVRVTPEVDVNAAESVIRWPAWKSKEVAALPIEVHVAKAQWSDRSPVSDQGFIGPSALALRVDWPEPAEERAKAPAQEAAPVVYYFRSHGGRGTHDLLYDERYRSAKNIVFASPLTAAREEAVVVYCPSYSSIPCEARFEYLGRSAQFAFPRRRADDWEEGYKRARQVLVAAVRTQK
jgi:hypothetical protein